MVLAVALTLLAVSMVPLSLAQDYNLSYQFISNGETYNLKVTISNQLNQYYSVQSHSLSSSADLGKFVTPYALKPIADRLRQIYSSDEDFANGVLMLVHQITYEEITPGKFPVETMVAGKGDCDLFSYIAASVMKAGGLYVVLLYYRAEAHMNIAVHLSDPPTKSIGDNYYVKYDGLTYYVAECTGGNWESGWKIGECPQDYMQSDPEVITLESANQIEPGQVSASFTDMRSGSVSLDVSSAVIAKENTLTISGKISPDLQNENVILYAKAINSPWQVIGSACTAPNGSFSYNWAAQSSNLYAIQAGWSSDGYCDALSATKAVTVLPASLEVMTLAILAVVSAGIIALFQCITSGKRKNKS